jgi:hypothetical protein
MYKQLKQFPYIGLIKTINELYYTNLELQINVYMCMHII